MAEPGERKHAGGLAKTSEHPIAQSSVATVADAATAVDSMANGCFVAAAKPGVADVVASAATTAVDGMAVAGKPAQNG